MRKVIVDTSERLQVSGPTALDELEQVARRLTLRGTSIIDFGRFAPRIDPDPELFDRFRELIGESPVASGRSAAEREFRETAAAWFRARFGVRLSPARGILPVPGVRQAVYELALALINAGDPVGIPDPCYPLYRTAALYVGARICSVPLQRAHEYLPNLDRLDLPENRPRVLILNYPHNPTSTTSDRSFYVELVRWARRRNVVVVQDFAYGEIGYDGEPPVSILTIPGARQVAVELHSFSFTYNLPGLRLGFAAGHPDILAALGHVQHQLGSRPGALALRAGTEAIRAHPRVTSRVNREYLQRRDAVTRGLDGLGWVYRKPVAGPFFWLPVPRRRDDTRLARRMLMRAGVLIAPGVAFGEGGEGYMRLSLAPEVPAIETAFRRLQKLWPERLGHMRKTWGSSDSNE